MVDTNFFEAKITFVVAEMTLKVSMITSPVAKITFVVAEIFFNVAVITSLVAKITFVVAEIFFLSGCTHLFSGKDHFCGGLDIFKVVVITSSVAKITL